MVLASPANQADRTLANRNNSYSDSPEIDLDKPIRSVTADRRHLQESNLQAAQAMVPTHCIPQVMPQRVVAKPLWSPSCSLGASKQASRAPSPARPAPRAPSPARPAPAAPAPNNGNVAPTVVGPNVTGKREEYQLVRRLQSALFGGVYAAKGLSSGKDYAIKVLHKNELSKAQDASPAELCEIPLSEIRFADVMRDCDQVMEVEEHFEDAFCYYIVFELARGGDLLEALKHKPQGFNEGHAQYLIQQAVKGLAYLHKRHVAMQDVSLENMLLHVNEEALAFTVKLCDPGQAIVFDYDAQGQENTVPFRGLVGKSFRPPELHLQRPYYATKVDSWCLGWSTFYLLTAQPLFMTADPRLQDADWLLWQAGEYFSLFQQKGAMCSPAGLDFILRLLRTEPSQRMSITDALDHAWLADPKIAPMPAPPRDSSPTRARESSPTAKTRPIPPSQQLQQAPTSATAVAATGGSQTLRPGPGTATQPRASGSPIPQDRGIHSALPVSGSSLEPPIMQPLPQSQRASLDRFRGPAPAAATARTLAAAAASGDASNGRRAQASRAPSPTTQHYATDAADNLSNTASLGVPLSSAPGSPRGGSMRMRPVSVLAQTPRTSAAQTPVPASGAKVGDAADLRGRAWAFRTAPEGLVAADSIATVAASSRESTGLPVGGCQGGSGHLPGGHSSAANSMTVPSVAVGQQGQDAKCDSPDATKFRAVASLSPSGSHRTAAAANSSPSASPTGLHRPVAAPNHSASSSPAGAPYRNVAVASSPMGNHRIVAPAAVGGRAQYIVDGMPQLQQNGTRNVQSTIYVPKSHTPADTQHASQTSTPNTGAGITGAVLMSSSTTDMTRATPYSVRAMTPVLRPGMAGEMTVAHSSRAGAPMMRSTANVADLTASRGSVPQLRAGTPASRAATPLIRGAIAEMWMPGGQPVDGGSATLAVAAPKRTETPQPQIARGVSSIAFSPRAGTVLSTGGPAGVAASAPPGPGVHVGATNGTILSRQGSPMAVPGGGTLSTPRTAGYAWPPVEMASSIGNLQRTASPNPNAMTMQAGLRPAYAIRR